jgi:23S rRNA (adenine2030-N6)-methyltransferase
MLSYQHAYHAGGPADVHKHALLWGLLDALRRKDKAFVAVDLYAGEGIYDLGRAEARKLNEHTQGIGRLWDQTNLPPELARFVEAVRQFNPDGSLAWYPGSPALLRARLRSQDQLILNELHPTAVAALRAWARNDERIAVHCRDAAEAISGLLPPAIRRGLVLIDPSYEDRRDYTAVADGVRRAQTRWQEATLAIWYPRLADGREQTLVQRLSDLAAPTLMSVLDFDAPGLRDAPALGLRGSGMLIVNPPWQFDRDAANLGDRLAATLGQGPKAHHTLAWITPDR